MLLVVPSSVHAVSAKMVTAAHRKADAEGRKSLSSIYVVQMSLYHCPMSLHLEDCFAAFGGANTLPAPCLDFSIEVNGSFVAMATVC